MTHTIRLDAEVWTAADLAPAAAWIHAGHVVAFPTDTLYGLAVDPGSAAAVAALYDVKGRPAHAPIPLLASSVEQVERWFGHLSGATGALARAFWPGPLSVLLDAPEGIAAAVHAGTRTVAVRVPALALARAFADACGHPITATSANRSGEPPVAAAGALGSIAADPRVLVLDGGPSPGGAPSTIVDARGDTPVLVRAGAIAWDRVLRSAYA